MHIPNINEANGIIILGICPLTKGTLNIFQENNLLVYGILDDDKQWHNKNINHIPVLGATDNPEFLKLLNESCSVFIAYDSMKIRKSRLNLLSSQNTLWLISAIHPSAIIAKDVHIGQGNYIDAKTCLASEVTIGDHCVIHSGVIIETESKIHNFVQIGPGSIIGSGVTIEEEVFIGPGVTIIPNVTIQKGASIGAGSVVLGNVKKGDIILGNPGKSIKQA